MWSPVRTSSPETPRSTVVDMCRLPSQELNQNPTPESRVIAPRGRKQRQGSSHQDDAARIANAASPNAGQLGLVGVVLSASFVLVEGAEEAWCHGQGRSSRQRRSG